MPKDEKDIDGLGLDFQADLAIDPDELDIAALEQSNLAMKYSREAAHYDRVSKKAYEAVKTLRSQLTREANEDPDGCLGKGNKATGANVEAYYRTHPDYIKAKNAMIDAEYQRDLVKAAADHISFQRSKMIQVLSSLLNAEYFAAPGFARDLKKEWQARKEKKDIGERANEVAPRRRSK